jgi:hypothetical protein
MVAGMSDLTNVTSDGSVIHEQLVKMEGTQQIDVRYLWLSTVGGDLPGTLLQNGEFDKATGEVPIMYYSSSKVRPTTFDWYFIDEAVENADFQYGQFNISFYAYEKCVQVNFTEEMSSKPAVILQLKVKHKLSPFFLDYSLVEIESVILTG